MAAFDGTPRAEKPSTKALSAGALAEFFAMLLFVYYGCGSAASNFNLQPTSFTLLDKMACDGTALTEIAQPVHASCEQVCSENKDCKAFTQAPDGKCSFFGDRTTKADDTAACMKKNISKWDPASVAIIALQFGFGITVLAYFSAHVSGGHINCAVTLALTLAGKCHPVQGAVYFVAQMLGSIAGAGLLAVTTASGTDNGIDLTGGVGANGFQNDDVTVTNAFFAEMISTFLLLIVVFETAVNSKSVATSKSQKIAIAPLPIGLAVFLAHVVCIPITGCSINPTRSFGPSVVAGSWDNHWVWWVGPCTGAILAALVWMVMQNVNKDDAEEAKAEDVPLKKVEP